LKIKPEALNYFQILIRTLPTELKCMIYKDLVSDQTTQKDLMNELKLYHRIGNFSIQIQLLIIKMLKKIYPNLWPLTDRNIDYLVDVYNLMKDCNCFHCRYITFPYTLLIVYKDYPNFTFIRYHIFYLHRVKNISYS
jgi:hypothetical protein